MTTTPPLTNEDRKRYLQLRKAFNGKVIGITGHVGKTSTLHMLQTVLSRKGKVLRPKNNIGNWKTVIDTLNRLSNDYRFALFEFDYRQNQNFAELLRMIKPDMGIVTNIGDSHLNYLGGMVKIALKKSEVVKYLNRDGVAILNQDDEMTSALSQYITVNKIIKYGITPAAEYYARDIRQKGPQGTQLTLNDQYEIRLPLYSIQDVYNFLAAAATAVQLGFKTEEIINIFDQHLKLPPGHGRLHHFGDTYMLDESYYATPQSMSKAARSLIAFKPFCKQLIFIVGDMSGAGINVEDQHLNMGYFLSALPIDLIISVGEYARYIAKGAELITNGKKRVYYARNTDEILKYLEKHGIENAAISVKGISATATHRIARFLKN